MVKPSTTNFKVRIRKYREVLEKVALNVYDKYKLGQMTNDEKVKALDAIMSVVVNRKQILRGGKDKRDD